MGQTVGEIDLGLSINQASFNKQLLGLANSAEKPVMNAFKPLGRMIGSALAIGSVVKFTKSCLDLGSDLIEVQNVVDTTFETMKNDVNDFAKNALKQFGLSETVSKQYMGTLGAMSKSMGFTEQASYEMSKAVTGLAGDVASFYNLSTDEAFDKLKSIWTGETETLKSIGVLLTQTNLDQYALNNGFGKTTAQMTEQEKVMLRYRYTMSALSDASGDFAKTSGSWANQTRILSLQFESLKATLGQGFINLFTPIIQMINELIAKLQVLAQSFKAFTEAFSGDRGTSSAVSTIAADSKDAVTGLSNVESAAKKAAKACGLLATDELNVLNKTTASETASSGGIDVSSSVVDNATAESVTAVETGMQKILDMINPFSTALKELWNGGLSKLGAFSVQGLKDFYNEFLVPVGTWAFGTEDKGLTRLVNIINEDLCGVNWDTINRNLKEFWIAVEPYAEEFGEGLIDFFEDAADVSIDILENLFGADGVLVNLTDWLNNNDPELAREWGYNLGVLSAALFAFRKIAPVLTILNQLLAFFGMKSGLNKTLKSLGGLSGVLTTDLTTIFGAGTAAEIGLTIGTGIVSGITTAIVGFDVGKWLGEKLFPESEKYYENFTWFGEGGFFPSIADDFGLSLEALKCMLTDFENNPVVATLANALAGPFVSGGAQAYAFGEKVVDEVFPKLVELGAKAVRIGIAIKESLLGKLGETVAQWKTDISKWWNESVSPWFTKEKWLRSMAGIKDAFSQVFKNACNAGVERFNKFINAINSMMNISWDSVSVMGKEIIPAGNMQLFSIPNIPALAEGGYVKPNQPQLAMIGDNRHQGEVVAPEDKLQEIAAKAVNSALQSSNGMSERLLEKILEILTMIMQLLAEGRVLEVDGQDLGRIIQRLNMEYFDVTGKYLLEV